MHIVYAFPEPLPLPRARGVQVVNAITSLAEQDVKITLAYCATDEDPFAYYGVAKHPNIELVALSRGLPWPLHKLKAHSNKLFILRLREWLRSSETRFDCIFVRHLKLAFGLIKSTTLPLVYEAHEVFAETAPEEKKEKIRRMELMVANHAKIIIANSRATADCLQKLYTTKRPIYVLPNGVTRPKTKTQKDWANISQHIIYAGSLFAWKGVEDLILAARQLGGAQITVIGGSEEAIAKLKPLIISGAKIDFVGHIPHNEVMEHLNRACIAVLPNRADTDSRFTSPIKLFEYMAAGCAIVASDLPSLKEIVNGDEVVFVKANDPTALASGIQKLMADPQLAQAMAEKVRNKSSHYTWEARAIKLKSTLSLGLKHA